MSEVARRMFPMLSCSDFERSLVFYRDLLGGVETYRFPPEGDPAFLVLRLGESDLGLGAVAAEPIHGQAQRPVSGHRVELCIYVADVDTAVERMRDAGAEVIVEPIDQPWGERMAYVADPDGNLLMLTR